MAADAILAERLTKTYHSPRGDVAAVRGISLEIPEGAFFGVLGPNGAGKSTTIGMLTTLIRPTGGRGQVAGYDVVKRPTEVKRRIGVMSQNITLDRKLTVQENLEFRARYFGLRPPAARRRAEELLEVLELTARRGALVHELSGGQARRVMAGRALVHRPEVLFLDEPTAGVDPQARANMWDLFRDLHAQGLTIVLTTHHLDEAEQLCERMAIVDHGSILACDGIEGLSALAGADHLLTVRFDGPAPDVGDVAQQAGVRRVAVTDDEVRVFAADLDGLLGQLIRRGLDAGRTVLDVTTTRPRLEHVFLALTGRKYRE